VAATPSVRVVKSFTFKGGSRLFSNRYHFDGGAPSDATHWHTLMDNVTAVEKLCFYSNVTIVEALGYAAGSDVPVATKTYALAGTLTPGSGGYYAPGECAILLRYATATRTVKNHPLYLFNYFHGVLNQDTAVGADKPDVNQRTNIGAYAADWIAGFSDGTVTHHRAGPNGDLATGSLVEEYITHRDFPYSTSV
jgi:hypothetical protein